MEYAQIIEMLIHVLVLIGVWINTAINIVHRINSKKK